MPRLGSFHLLAATAGVNLALAAAISFAGRETRRLEDFAAARTISCLLAAAVFIGFSRYFYDPAVASFNTLMYWNLYDRPLTLRENAHALDIVYFRDGLNANISVARTDDYMALRTNGKVDASNHDATTQLLLGHLGALCPFAAPRAAGGIRQRHDGLRAGRISRTRAPGRRGNRTRRGRRRAAAREIESQRAARSPRARNV